MYLVRFVFLAKCDKACLHYEFFEIFLPYIWIGRPTSTIWFHLTKPGYIACYNVYQLICMFLIAEDKNTSKPVIATLHVRRI